MLSPLPRRSGWAYSSLCCTQPYQPSPKGLSGRPAHCPFRGLLSVHSRYGLHTVAVTNSAHSNRRLQPLRCLHDCSDCFRLERLPGGVRTHWKAPPCHGAHPTADIAGGPVRAINGSRQPYSITSSARPSNVAGISMPSALAVFRLIASSNLVG